MKIFLSLFISAHAKYIYIYTYIYYIIDLYIYIYVLTWNVKFILTIQGDIFLKSGIFRIIYM